MGNQFESWLLSFQSSSLIMCLGKQWTMAKTLRDPDATPGSGLGRFSHFKSKPNRGRFSIFQANKIKSFLILLRLGNIQGLVLFLKLINNLQAQCFRHQLQQDKHFFISSHDNLMGSKRYNFNVLFLFCTLTYFTSFCFAQRICNNVKAKTQSMLERINFRKPLRN